MSIDDTYIVKQLKADTAKGFALLVKRYTEPIYWHIRRMVVSHDVYANNAGTYTSGIASLQCQYAPALTSHSAGTSLTVR